ncbi:MAG: PQQ-binding-like beta-propeller repeat protein [Armatimonadetes bacterium]|nr:PQQ-binding-like beta-propeller repeat protein [Armatimonadota bacterium]
MKRLWMLLTLCALPHLTSAQYSLAWIRQFDGPDKLVDRPAEAIVDAYGNVYVGGTVDEASPSGSNDFAVLKYSPSGRLLWSTLYDGPSHGQDDCFDLALSPDGSLYAVGRTATLTSSTDYVTLKLDAATGAIVWTRLFDGPAGSIDQAMAVATDAQGNVFVTGEVWADHVPFSNGDYCTLKYLPDGTLAWSRTYNGPANFIAISDQPRAIVVDSHGDVVVTGDSPFSDNADDMLTVKYRSSDGAELWTARYSALPSSENAVSLAIGPDDDVLVGGNTQTNGLRVTLMRLKSTTGATLWQVDDAFPHGGRLANRSSMAVSPTGDLAISVTYDPDLDNSNLNYNIQTSKYRYADGFREWSVSTGTSATFDGQAATSVAFDREGDVWVGGGELVVPKNLASAWRFSGLNGELLWQGVADGPRQPDKVIRLRTTRQGDVILVGTTGVDVGTGDSDVQTLKFSRKLPRPVSPSGR